MPKLEPADAAADLGAGVERHGLTGRVDAELAREERPAVLLQAAELEDVDSRRKKSRFSGKNKLKRVRLTWRSSTSVAEKSVFIVRAALSCGVTL